MEEKENLFIKVEELFNEGLSVAQVVIELGVENKKHISIYYAKLKRLNKRKIKEGIFNVDEFENWII
jgi:hypothetical protein